MKGGQKFARLQIIDLPARAAVKQRIRSRSSLHFRYMPS